MPAAHNFEKKSLELHERFRGKLEIKSKVKISNKNELAVAYTPGVAEPCRKIAKNKKDAYRYTIKANTVAVITEGSSILGLGNIGALAGLPVMEGKCVLMKQFADIDAFPICVATQEPDEFIKTVINIAPSFGAINLEDIKAPNCFYIEDALKKKLDIPVFHDDQHGTAIVVLAGLLNALKIVRKKIGNVSMVISGAGAAGIAIAKLLLRAGARHITLADHQGTIYEGRGNLNIYKKKIAKKTNLKKLKGDLSDAVKGADVFIGVSAPGILKKSAVKTMAENPIIFAMSNPAPEIMPEDAASAGAKIIATGRSDYPNQINNVLAFPGVLRGILDCKAGYVTDKMKLSAAKALAKLVKKPTPRKIIPGVFDKGVAKSVAEAIVSAK